MKKYVRWKFSYTIKLRNNTNYNLLDKYLSAGQARANHKLAICIFLRGFKYQEQFLTDIEQRAHSLWLILYESYSLQVNLHNF